MVGSAGIVPRVSTAALAREKPPTSVFLKAEPNPVGLPFISPAAGDGCWSAGRAGCGPRPSRVARTGRAWGSGRPRRARRRGRRSGFAVGAVAAAWSASSATRRITSCSRARCTASAGVRGIRSPYTAARLPTRCASTIGRCDGVEPRSKCASHPRTRNSCSHRATVRSLSPERDTSRSHVGRDSSVSHPACRATRRATVSRFARPSARISRTQSWRSQRREPMHADPADPTTAP